MMLLRKKGRLSQEPKTLVSEIKVTLPLLNQNQNQNGLMCRMEDTPGEG